MGAEGWGLRAGAWGLGAEAWGLGTGVAGGLDHPLVFPRLQGVEAASLAHRVL